MPSNSFVENVNIVANSITLAHGDIVEDTKTARDEAIIAAAAAIGAEANVRASEQLARKWAENGHNNPVQGGPFGIPEFSSYHWAVEASLIIGDPIINDHIESLNYTWSSEKIKLDLFGKSDTTHDHDQDYEPIFAKNSAFNKNFGSNGVSLNVSRDDHLHASEYEPKRATLGTAYNRDFGTSSGSVMEGDTNFDNDYMPLIPINSAYNKNFVADTNAPQANEVNRGNHVHKASGVIFDNTGTSIRSGTSQGALEEISAHLDSIELVEASYITLIGQTEYTQAISAQNTPTKLLMPIPNIYDKQNADNNANADITIDYSLSSLGKPSKLVEGRYTATVNFVNTTDIFALNVSVDGAIKGESVKGMNTVAISQFITGIDVTGVNGSDSSVIALHITNLTSANDAVVSSANIVWNGEPQGSVVASSSLHINHEDVLARDAVAQHPVSSIYETGNIGVSLDDLLDAKIGLVSTPVLDNIVSQLADGTIKDSGIAIGSIAEKMSLVTVPVLDNIVTMSTLGDSEDGGVKISELARLNGDAAQNFKVANSVSDDDAVNQGQISILSSIYTPKTEFDAHVAEFNPHQTTYTDVGAAALNHLHLISAVVGLADALAGKYTVLSTAITNNLAAFAPGGILIDSGMSADSKLLIGEAI